MDSNKNGETDLPLDTQETRLHVHSWTLTTAWCLWLRL